jgi:hypothetical protein
MLHKFSPKTIVVMAIISVMIMSNLSCSVVSSLLATSTPTATFTPSPTATLTPTPTATFTPTPIPLANRDLSQMVLRSSDVPSNYSGVVIYDGVEETNDVYSRTVELHSNLVDGYYAGFNTADWVYLIQSGVFVYDNEENSQKAYRALIFTYGGQSVVTPVIGSESTAFSGNWTDANGYIYYYSEVIWRYKEAVAFLYISGPYKPLDSELVRLTQLMQARIEGLGE